MSDKSKCSICVTTAVSIDVDAFPSPKCLEKQEQRKLLLPLFFCFLFLTFFLFFMRWWSWHARHLLPLTFESDDLCDIQKGGGPPQTQKKWRDMAACGWWWQVQFDSLIFNFLRKPHVQRPMNASLSSVKYLFFLSVRIKERQGRNLYRNIKYHFNELFCEWEKRTFEMQKSEKEKRGRIFFFLKKKKKKVHIWNDQGLYAHEEMLMARRTACFFQLRCFEFFF